MNIFHRINWENWHLFLAGAALILIFAVFILALIRILRTPNLTIEHLSNLPLEDETVAHEKRTAP